MMTNIVGLPATPEALVLDMPLRVRFEPRGDVSLPVFGPAGLRGERRDERSAGVIIAGAAETDEIGRLPDHSTLGLHLEGAQRGGRRGPVPARHRRHRDRLRARPGPGRARARHHPGLDRRHRRRRHLVPAARAARGRGDPGGLREDDPDHPRRVGPVPGRRVAGSGWTASSPAGQFEAPYGTFGPTTTFTIPVLRYMKEYGLTHEQLAYVAVAQRQWAAKNPRATFRDPITVEDVLASRMVAYPFHLLECCLVTDGGGALIVTVGRPGGGLPQARRARARHRRVVGDADDLADGRLHRVAGVPPGRPRGLRRGGHQHGRRRPPDDLRRVRARARSTASRRSASSTRARRGAVHRRRQHRAGRVRCR